MNNYEINEYNFVIFISDCIEATKWYVLLHNTIFDEYELLSEKGKIISYYDNWRICKSVKEAEKKINDHLNEMMQYTSIAFVNQRRLRYIEQLLKLKKTEIESKEIIAKLINQMEVKEEYSEKGAVRWLKSAISKLGIL